MSDSILFTVSDDGLAHVTLNRPERLNAINAEAAHRWREIAGEIARRDDIRAVLFDAAGRAFCAGGDVMEMAALAAAGPETGRDAGAAVRELADVIHAGHLLLRESGTPIVAAVQGVAAGGGLGFMLVADIIVAAETARFASKYADVALTPDCGVTSLLPEAVGERRALELLLTPRTLTAAEALDWGLVTEVTAPDAVAERARAIADSWLGGAPAAFAEAKRLLRAARTRSFRESLDDEAGTIGAAFATPEAMARVAAFARR
ncbi:enoyl-CoA hydratase/isomerase family protein [Microterricola viridarii]|uniref:Enoyl-CoA hydratase n=1 Tax=Microterricola viridarii TaxID=412690 RepID=A0A1H1NDH8_9MICO|nr:enoyl-CoA hydratase/isomerase family protein [Microterricola viridarii]SDR97006.1 Enoyl-CoA hydratase [Microterricola viridarii]